MTSSLRALSTRHRCHSQMSPLAAAEALFENKQTSHCPSFWRNGVSLYVEVYLKIFRQVHWLPSWVIVYVTDDTQAFVYNHQSGLEISRTSCGWNRGAWRLPLRLETFALSPQLLHIMILSWDILCTDQGRKAGSHNLSLCFSMILWC